MRHAIKTMIFAAAAVLLAGCASSGGAAKIGGTAGERSVARWQAIIDRKPDLAYDYLTPGVRSTKSREAYVVEQNQKPVQYFSVALDSEACEADACTVTVELEFGISITLPDVQRQRLTSFVVERWVRSKGAWYLLPDAFR